MSRGWDCILPGGSPRYGQIRVYALIRVTYDSAGLVVFSYCRNTQFRSAVSVLVWLSVLLLLLRIIFAGGAVVVVFRCRRLPGGGMLLWCSGFLLDGLDFA